MKKVVILVSVFCVTIAANAAQLKSYLDYIAQWKEVAMQPLPLSHWRKGF